MKLLAASDLLFGAFIALIALCNATVAMSPRLGSPEFPREISNIYGFQSLSTSENTHVVLFIKGKSYFKGLGVTDAVLFIAASHTDVRAVYKFSLKEMNSLGDGVTFMRIDSSDYYFINVRLPPEWKHCPFFTISATFRGRLINGSRICSPEECPNMSNHEDCPIYVKPGNADCGLLPELQHHHCNLTQNLPLRLFNLYNPFERRQPTSVNLHDSSLHSFLVAIFALAVIAALLGVCLCCTLRLCSSTFTPSPQTEDSSVNSSSSSNGRNESRHHSTVNGNCVVEVNQNGQSTSTTPLNFIDSDNENEL